VRVAIGLRRDAPRERKLGGVSGSARFSPFQRGPLDVPLGRWSLDHSPMFLAMDVMSRLFSPYDLNPHGDNPLHEVLAESIDFQPYSRGTCVALSLSQTRYSRAVRLTVVQHSPQAKTRSLRPLPVGACSAEPA
jgi:hypothetical protein